MVQLYQEASGPVWIVLLTHQHLEQPPETCPVSWDSIVPCFLVLSNFPYPGKLSLKDPIKPQAKSKDVSPLSGVYIEYPLPTEWNLGGTATGTGDRMGGPHAFNSFTLYTAVDPATSMLNLPIL